MAQSEYNRPSPYVADSGAVGHLGQPMSGGSDNPRPVDYPSRTGDPSHNAPADYPSRDPSHNAPTDYPSRTGDPSHNAPADYPSRTGDPSHNAPSRTGDPSHNAPADYPSRTGDPYHTHPSHDQGLHYGGKETGAHPVSEMDRVQHPLQATHDTNIGHGHEPFEQSPYVQAGDATVAGTGQERTVGDRMKNAGQGFRDAFTGYKERPVDAPQQQHKPGIVEKVNNAVTGQYPGKGTATGNATEENYAGRADHKHNTGFPQPVPPPGMFKPNLSAQDHYSPNYDQAGQPHGTGHSGISPSVGGATGHSGISPSAGGATGHSGISPSAGGGTGHSRISPSAGGGTGHFGISPSAGGGTGHSEISPSAGGTTGHSGITPSAGGAIGHSGISPSTGGATEHVSSTGEPMSTPAEPHARHDTPGVHNTGGAEHLDTHGRVHKEGPRDDNVKKEGLMTKVMEKLHIPCGTKHPPKDTTM